MKKQRKNTVSREAAEKEMPKAEAREKRPGNFDKRPRPSRKPRRDRDDREKNYSSGRSGGGEKKEYFQEFYKENSKKRKEDFKPKKEKNATDESGKKIRRNKIDSKSIKQREEREPRRDFGRREERTDRKPRGNFRKREERDDRKPRRAFDNRDERKPRREEGDREKRPYAKERTRNNERTPSPQTPSGETRARKPKWSKEQKLERAIKEGRVAPPEETEAVPEKMPLNKYISRAGICSRREAADLIKAGEVKVNGAINKEPGYKVVDGDVVTYQGNDLEKQEKMVYLLLNKAKDYITTTDDPEGRKTVMDLFTTVDERIFPVGRLDRNTTGLLLVTNDGHLAQKLSHPKFMNKKVYQVKLDKPLVQEDFDKIEKGLELEDGLAEVDSLAYTNPEDQKEIGIEIHIGKNRIVRRIFEELGYEVKHLDRVMYAGLTKKNLPRGKWRALTDKELVFLKHYK